MQQESRVETEVLNDARHSVAVAQTARAQAAVPWSSLSAALGVFFKGRPCTQLFWQSMSTLGDLISILTNCSLAVLWL